MGFSCLNVNNLRQQIGYVGQLPLLFNGTVRYNILLGKPDATADEIIASAKAAHAHNFIMNLPQVSTPYLKVQEHLLFNSAILLILLHYHTFIQGYDSEVGPGGGMLSGGQKQVKMIYLFPLICT